MKIRLCPDCGTAPLHKYQRYCSDCSEARHYIVQVIGQQKHNQKPERKEYLKKYMAAYKAKHREEHKAYMKAYHKARKNGAA